MDSEERDQVIDPHFDCNCGLDTPNKPTLYLMHYDDVHFFNSYYQSIRPKPKCNVTLPTRINNLVGTQPQEQVSMYKFKKYLSIIIVICLNMYGIYL